MTNSKVLLMILDGWGIGNRDKSDVIFSTPTPYIDGLIQKYPNSQLLACGENVGLPDGQMGNSEVGHLNIGAGRVVYQDLVRINKDIKENQLEKMPALVNSLKYAKEKNVAVHFSGFSFRWRCSLTRQASV
jgi:2,3-bisphosphoglycerate-independent phosphoglycerate mutase